MRKKNWRAPNLKRDTRKRREKKIEKHAKKIAALKAKLETEVKTRPTHTRPNKIEQKGYETEFSKTKVRKQYFQYISENGLFARKINALLCKIANNPTEQFSELEPLKENLSGYFSMELNHEHRFVFRWESGNPIKFRIHSCVGHYEK